MDIIIISSSDISVTGKQKEASIAAINKIVANLPLSEPVFYILLSLATGKKHGYAILKETETLSAGRVRLSVSTLYEALGRLLMQDLIARVDTENEVATNRPRKAYVLTQAGRMLLEIETERMQSLVSVARLRLVWKDENA